MNLARAAANTASLEHYIWSTCPSVKKQSAGKYVTPHSKKEKNLLACQTAPRQ